MSDIHSARIDLSTSCNLRCLHCCADDVSISGQEIFPLNKAIEIVDFLARNGIKQLNILGKETLMYPYIRQLLEFASSKGLNISITTNGTITNKSLIKFLTELDLSTIFFSLDGATATVNDHIRGKGVFNTVIQTIELFVALREKERSHTKFTVNTVLNSINLNEIHLMLKLCNQLGVNAFNLLQLEPLGRAASLENPLHVSYKEQFAVADCAFSASLAYPELSITILSTSPLFLEYFYKKCGVNSPIKINGCKACRSEIYIDYEGNLSPCLSTSSKFIESTNNFYQPYSIPFPEYINGTLDGLAVFTGFKERYPLVKETYSNLNPCKSCPYLTTICYPCPLLSPGPHYDPLCSIAYSRGLELGYWS